MHILIAPNTFKGSLPAEEAAQAIAGGLKRSRLSCTCSLFPIADGGDNTVPLLLKGMGGITHTASAHDALGRPRLAAYGWVEASQKALVALSEASGIAALDAGERQPLHANTYGTGELIADALRRGARELIIGVGGSATTDGGTGLLRALGLRLLDSAGAPISDLPAGLLGLSALDLSNLAPALKDCPIQVLCDVRNPLLGPRGAAAVFGPQKGAGPQEVKTLEACLEKWNQVTLQQTGRDMSALPSAGAAGGAAAGLYAYAGARLVSGIDYFLDTLDFGAALSEADLVITGEGRIDAQTMEGKGPWGVALRARARGLPVIGMAGSAAGSLAGETGDLFTGLWAVNPPGMPLEEAMASTAIHLEQAARRLGDRLAETGLPR